MREPAFNSSCPSRVFPCKHGAVLLLARQPALFAAAAPPVWLEGWLAKRQPTQGKKVDKVALAVEKARQAPLPGKAAAAAATTPSAGTGREVAATRLAWCTRDKKAWRRR